MKIRKNAILASTLALLMTLSAFALSISPTKADTETEPQELPVVQGPWGVWYKFETPLITLIFPTGGRKPMFLWWYTNDNSTIYVVKFQGLFEYLTFEVDKPYYRNRTRADNATIYSHLWENCLASRVRSRWGYGQKFMNAKSEFLAWLSGLHSAYLPFSACKWNLTEPRWVEDENASYLAFNFVLSEVEGHRRLKFAEGNVEIRCRFYNVTATETPDEHYRNYNYTVNAGQLKFDFVVKNWEWNIDKLKPFLELLENVYKIDVPDIKTGLALWVNMASISIEKLTCAQNEVQNQAENQIETQSQMQGVVAGDKYYPVGNNETSQDEKPVQATLQIREQLRERIRLHFAVGKTNVPVGFLEFVPWARLLNETGGTVDFVNVTASYIAAGGHMRLFICYPYFGNYTLEHDPTIGLASAPTIPELVTPRLLIVLVGATIAIAVAVAAVKMRKKPVNIVKVY